MQSLVESAANRFSIPLHVVDILGRDYVSRLVEDLPDLLPPFMHDLKQVLECKGVVWMKANVDYLRRNLLLLRQMYGPEREGEQTATRISNQGRSDQQR